MASNYKWQVDFTNMGTKLWLDMSDSHNNVLERALSHGADIVLLQHTRTTKKYTQRTTIYVVSMKNLIQCSVDSGRVRKIRRVFVRRRPQDVSASLGEREQQRFQ